jgi:hypothetical protein
MNCLQDGLVREIHDPSAPSSVYIGETKILSFIAVLSNEN